MCHVPLPLFSARLHPMGEIILVHAGPVFEGCQGSVLVRTHHRLISLVGPQVLFWSSLLFWALCCGGLLHVRFSAMDFVANLSAVQLLALLAGAFSRLVP